jgi:hypothetical protein
MTALGQGLTQKNRSKHSLSITTSNKRINEPNITFPNLSQPNQESPTGSLSGTKLNQMDEPTQGTHVPQVAAIHHRTRPFKKTRPTRTRMGPQIHHCIMGPFTSNMALPQRRLTRRHKHTSQTLQNRRTRTGKTQLRKRYTELQTILHRFQQKHFDSPDTVNNLRYDSQKCWTALAKLFLDEAASRLPSTNNELLPRYLTT